MQNIDIGEIDFRGQVTVTQLATGEAHVLALDTDNQVWSWGLNDKGQLGINTGGYKEHMKMETPVKIDLL